MAVVVEAVKWIPELDRASQTATEKQFVATYRVFFQACDPETGANTLGTPFDALTATDGTTSIPAYGSQLGSTGLFVIDKNAQRCSEPTAVDVNVTFSNLAVNTSNSGKWNKDISSDGVAFTENSTRDKDDNLIVNSTGDPVEVPKTRYDEKIVVSFQTNTLDADGLAAVRGAINSDAVNLTIKGVERTFPEKTLKLANAPWKISYTDGTFTAYSVSIELLHRKDTWYAKIPDKGLRVLNDDGKPVPALDANGVEVTNPIYLDGSGGKLDTSGSAPVAAVFFPTDGVPLDDEVAFMPLFEGI